MEQQMTALPSEFDTLYDELKKRCSTAGIEITESEGVEEEVTIEVNIPSGRDKRVVYLFDIDDLKNILSIPFERYIFISGYSAICSYTDGEIEAAMRELRPIPRDIFRLFYDSAGEKEQGAEKRAIILSPGRDDNGPEIEISSPSSALRALVRMPNAPHLTPSLKLRNIGVTQHDHALSLLTRISNSLLFQLELLYSASFALRRERQDTTYRRSRKKREVITNLQYPLHEYDEAPMSLYWYAKSAKGMPLLQYLAYYQVVEFYFPAYSQAEARRRIRTILKDPIFRHDRDADLGRLLTAIQVSRSGGFGDERAQFRATINECVDSADLRAFMTEDKERADFLSSKTKGLTDHKLPISNPTADLRNDVADRLYDIRCKIVHTKSEGLDGSVDLLLPFSKEAELLYYDIDLIQFVSQKVLVAASTPLKL